MINRQQRPRWIVTCPGAQAGRVSATMGYMLDAGEEARAELAERWETDAATLRATAARCLAEGDVEGASILHELAVHFEAQAQRTDKQPTLPVT